MRNLFVLERSGVSASQRFFRWHPSDPWGSLSASVVFGSKSDAHDRSVLVGIDRGIFCRPVPVSVKGCGTVELLDW